MALLPVLSTPFKDQKQYRVRIQELDPHNTNGRPYEEDLTENGWHADSLSDLPVVGDFLVLLVERFDPSTQSDPKTIQKQELFKVLTRLLDYQLFDSRQTVICNIVVERIEDRTIAGLLVKD